MQGVFVDSIEEEAEHIHMSFEEHDESLVKEEESFCAHGEHAHDPLADIMSEDAPLSDTEVEEQVVSKEKDIELIWF